MIRQSLAVAALLLLVACGQAPVDTTARYVREAPSGPVLVRAAANGDARVEAGDNVFIRKDGVDYVVMRDSQGEFSVRKDDLLALLAEGGRSQGIAPGARRQPEYATTPGAAETVAGVKGTTWKLHPKEVPSLVTAEVVIADDPALAHVGRALAMQTGFSIVRNSTLAGGPGNLEKAMIALFEKGMVLRFGKALRLDRIERRAIAADAFAIPQPVLDKAALGRRLAGGNGADETGRRAA